MPLEFAAQPPAPSQMPERVRNAEFTVVNCGKINNGRSNRSSADHIVNDAISELFQHLHIQATYALESAVSTQEQVIHPQLEATRGLERIRCPQTVFYPDGGCQLNHIPGQLDPDKIRLGKESIERRKRRVVIGLHWAYPALQPCQATHRRTDIRMLPGGRRQFPAHFAAEWLLAFNQVNQRAGVKERNHQSRPALRSVSIRALLRLPTGECESNHCIAVIPAGFAALP